MNSIEEIIRQQLLKARDRRLELEPLPSAEDICLFLENRLMGASLERLEECMRKDREFADWVQKLRGLKDADVETNLGPNHELMKKMISMADPPTRRLSNVSCPHCGKLVTAFKSPIRNQKILNLVWLILAVAGFGLSFLFKRYFMQCLAVALIFGLKWVIDSRAIKKQIMIYKALKEDDNFSFRANDRSSEWMEASKK